MSNGTSGPTVRSLLDGLGLDRVLGRGGTDDEDCSCDVSFDGRILEVDADGCDGDLAASAPCRERVVRAFSEREADWIVVSRDGLEYRYGGPGVDVLAAAGRFLELVGDRDERLAAAAAREPVEVADELSDRVGPIGNVGVQTGLTDVADEIDDVSEVLSATVGVTIGHYFVDQVMVDGARLRDVRSLDTGSEVRIYTRPDSVPLYTVDVVDISLSAEERDLLLDGYEAIAEGIVEGERAASRAIEHACDGPVDPMLAAILRKHTSGFGILEDLFADPRITDVYVTSPVSSNPLRVVVDGESMTTNVHLTADGAGALASRIRKFSGRAFSRANPTVDATAALDNGTGVRIAGVTDPVADGIAFAFRERADESFTLPALVENDTMTAEAAAFLSVAVERNAATLIAGTRGAGKTTLLGTLLYELTPDTRTIIIEDTPELPVDKLQAVDRDIQALRTGTGEGPEITAVDALRTALRMGDGALVVGEIRGEEAQVLYEAMRVGANANAVLGTIHGDGANEVFERVVSDLGVPASSFGATDLVVTVQAYRAPEGRKRRLAAIEEVIVGDDGIRFAPLYEIEGDAIVSADRVDRGESRFVDRLTGPDEEYADIRRAIAERSALLEGLAADGRTAPREVAAAYAGRGLD